VRTRLLLALTVLAAAGVAGCARADPCTAVSAAGAVPADLRIGARFGGTVAHIIDGDSLCVARGAGRQDWVEVRLADFNAPELGEPAGPAAKAALARVAAGREVVCVAGLRTYDRVAATCSIDGRSIGELLRAAGAASGGRGAGRRVARRVAVPESGGFTGEDAGGGAFTPGAFRNCAAARAAGAAPLRRGEPGYGPHLDRDGDGIACEPMPRR
jgi:micrococcal nuclease